MISNIAIALGLVSFAASIVLCLKGLSVLLKGRITFGR